jgi:malonyl CoA-acyl carrier protein transacylase
MEQYTALERIDVGRVLAQAEQLLVAGDVTNLENLVHALEAHRQQYLEVERQSSTAVRQLEQEFATLRGELAYNPAALEHYREMQLTLDLHLSRLQAGRKEAEALAGILVKLRPELERFGGRRKAIELAVRARAVQQELRQVKEAFLPVFEQVVEKIFALNRDAVAFNRTVSVAHLPQTQFLQCGVDLTQLLAAFADLDIVVTPEMEQLAANARSVEEGARDGVQRLGDPGFATAGAEEGAR